jgi:drug/metabolite transporter (DMT)-like permease
VRPAEHGVGVGVGLAIAAALTFGVTTPLVARVGAGVGAFTTAGLLYVGAMALCLVIRPFTRATGAAVGLAQLPRLAWVALFGAALAPACFAWGLQRADGLAASLLLNFEAVVSVLLARVFFKEALGRRVVLAIGAMLAGGALIALDGPAGHELHLLGILAVAAATVFWALDNTLTRPLSDFEVTEVVAAKAALGAAATRGRAVVGGEALPSISRAVLLLALGAMGFGLSLRFYLLAQRRIGAARTASVFATGPFVGAALSWALGARDGSVLTVLGAMAFAVGVFLHATERHGHHHHHHAEEHEHAHRHDDGHHAHQHEPPVSGEHSHRHVHEALVHEHEHGPDLHHAHTHDS